MDKEAAKDIEIDGIYLALDNLFDIPSPHAFGYFIRQRVDKVDTLHYVQSTGRYALIITSDERDGRFYEYFTTLNSKFSFISCWEDGEPEPEKPLTGNSWLGDNLV